MGIKNGDTARDTITGFEGVVVSTHTYLNGCVRFAIQPKSLHEGKPVEAQVFDEEQCELVSAAAPKTTAAPAKAPGGPRSEPRRAAIPAR